MILQFMVNFKTILGLLISEVEENHAIDSVKKHGITIRFGCDCIRTTVMGLLIL